MFFFFQGLNRKVQRATGDRRRIIWLAQWRQNHVPLLEANISLKIDGWKMSFLWEHFLTSAMFVLGRVYIVENGTFESVLSFLPPVKLPKCCETFAIAGKGDYYAIGMVYK